MNVFINLYFKNKYRVSKYITRRLKHTVEEVVSLLKKQITI